MVPELVMQSADSWPQGQGLNLTTSGIIPPMSNTNCYVLFYFAEIDPLARNETRVFDLILNQGPSQISYFNISVVSLSGGMYIASELVFNVTSNNALTIQLLPHPDSHLGPILNALELYVLTLPAPNRTLVSDGNQLTYNISSPPLLLKLSLIKSTKF
jgi:hypothetical protein